MTHLCPKRVQLLPALHTCPFAAGGHVLQGCKISTLPLVHDPHASCCLQVCSFFTRTGTCAYGNRCKFVHPMCVQPPQLNSRGYPFRDQEVSCAHYLKKVWGGVGAMQQGGPCMCTPHTQAIKAPHSTCWPLLQCLTQRMSKGLPPCAVLCKHWAPRAWSPQPN